MKAKYINKTMCGLKKGHEYTLYFKEPCKGQYTYEAHIVYDLTDDKGVDIFIQYASMKSINRNFKYSSFLLEE